MNEEISTVNQENSTENQEEVLFGGDENTKENSPDLLEENAEHLELLQKYFGYTSFRPLQQKIISTILSKDNKRDICAILQPDYGKSLCYQYPAAHGSGIVIVISSSTEKMRKQIKSLAVVDVPACLLTHQLGHFVRTQIQKEILNGYYKIVYMTPKFPMLERELMEDWYLQVKLIAIDEAHCISKGDKSFHYILRRKFPNSIFLCLSSAPSPEVQGNIISSWQLRKPLVVRSSFEFNRPHIYLEVQNREPSFLASLSQFSLTNDWKGLLDESTIIYAADAQEADRIEEELEAAAVPCRSYHGRHPRKALKQISEEFAHDEVGVLVTIHGYALDTRKPDVRRVIHAAAPISLASFWSEVGNAGRDGFPSTSLVFHTSNSEEAPRRPVADSMREYLELKSCRRAFLLRHLDGKETDAVEPRCECCDVCRIKIMRKQLNKTEYGLNDKGKYSVKDDCKALLTVMKSRRFKVHISKLLKDIEAMSDFQRQPHHKNQKWWEEISNFLLKENYIEPYYIGENVTSYPSGVTPKGDEFHAKLIANSVADVWMKPTWNMCRILIFSRHPEIMGYSDPSKKCFHTRRIEAMYKSLLDKRLKLAVSYGCMPYVIISKMALRIIAEQKPKDVDALRNLKLVGFSDKHIEKFGREFLTTSASGMPLKEVLLEYPLPYSTEDAAKAISEEISETAMKKSSFSPRKCETLAARIRQGWELKLSDFCITDLQKKMVANVFFTHEHLFSIVPHWSAAEGMTKFGELQMPVGHVLLTWSYLLVRKHLHDLQIHFEDFDPMPDFQQLLEQIDHLRTSEKQVEPCNTEKKQAACPISVALTHHRKLNARLSPPPVFNWSELWSTCVDYQSVRDVATKFGIALENIWDMLAVVIRRGFPVVLSHFGVTELVKWEVLTALLALQKWFLWADPTTRNAQEFRKCSRLLENIPLEIIALTWGYLQVRIFLYHLQVEFEDFEPMDGLKKTVEKERIVEFEASPKHCSLESVLSKTALASYIPHKDWWYLCVSSYNSSEVYKVAEQWSVNTSVVWECISVGIRKGLEIELSNFDITDAMRKTVTAAFLENTNKMFLWHVPTLPKAEQFRDLGRLNIETTKILLIWSYLQVRIHLHDLGETYTDFDQMKGLADFLSRCEEKRKRQNVDASTEEGKPTQKHKRLLLAERNDFCKDRQLKEEGCTVNDMQHVLTADDLIKEEPQDLDVSESCSKKEEAAQAQTNNSTDLEPEGKRFKLSEMEKSTNVSE